MMPNISANKVVKFGTRSAFDPDTRTWVNVDSHHDPSSLIDPNDISIPWSGLSLYTGSAQSLGTIQSWISACERDHLLCRAPPNATPYFPTRVIDVQELSSGNVFLRDNDEAISRNSSEEEEKIHPRRYPKYWTLSHRWGDPGRIKQLRKSTERQLRDGISLDSLSPTFRDAVVLVHGLGYKYLWIDSLCIFQDSHSDWQQEANNMVGIYRHSFCNIAAISSSHEPRFDTGLLCHRITNTDLG